jgi:plasmid stabilization system protein ParE
VTRYRYLPSAREELNEAVAFYEASVPGLGDAFLDDVERAIETVRERPQIGASMGRGFRKSILRRFPFTILCAARRRDHDRRHRPSTPASRLLARETMTANNALERTEVFVGRVCPRHGGGGRPLNSVVRAHSQYRLRVEEVRVFYDVVGSTVDALAIVPQPEAESWLNQFGSPE